MFYNTADLLRAAGHEVVLFGCEDDLNTEYQARTYTCRTWGHPGRFWEVEKYFNNEDAARRMDEVLEIEKPDLVHIHLFWGGITPSVIRVIHRHGIPVVHTVHDYRMVCPAYTFRNGKGEVCEKCIGGHFMECFRNRCSKGNAAYSFMMALEMKYRNRKWHPASELDGLIYVSEFARLKHEEADPLFRGCNSMVLYNCTNLSERYPVPAADEGYYLYYGRLSYEKGVKTLLEAVSGLPGIRMKVVGTGPLEESLKNACPSSADIEFLGYRSGSELFELVRRARFVVVPSEWYENNPMTVVEAYSLGVPVIGSRIGGIPEIVQEGKTGFLFESGNASSLASVLTGTLALSDSDYSGLVHNARQFADLHFNPHLYYDRLIAFYERTVSSYGR